MTGREMETEPRAETLCGPQVSGSQTWLHVCIMGSFLNNMNAWVLPRFFESSPGDSNVQESGLDEGSVYFIIALGRSVIW